MAKVSPRCRRRSKPCKKRSDQWLQSFRKCKGKFKPLLLRRRMMRPRSFRRSLSKSTVFMLRRMLLSRLKLQSIRRSRDNFSKWWNSWRCNSVATRIWLSFTKFKLMTWTSRSVVFQRSWRLSSQAKTRLLIMSKQLRMSLFTCKMWLKLNLQQPLNKWRSCKKLKMTLRLRLPKLTKELPTQSSRSQWLKTKFWQSQHWVCKKSTVAPLKNHSTEFPQKILHETY